MTTFPDFTKIDLATPDAKAPSKPHARTLETPEGIDLAKAYSRFAFVVWVRAALHRVRTDQILEFGWRYLLPLSFVNLAIAIWLRLEVWNSTAAGGWPIWTAPALFGAFVLLFIILAIDEDKEALELDRRMYQTQTLDKASPGTHRE